MSMRPVPVVNGPRRAPVGLALVALALALLVAACANGGGETGTDESDSSEASNTEEGESADTPADEEESAPGDEELATIRLQNCVGVLQVAVAPLLIGGELGFYEEEGIGEVTVSNTGSGSTATCVQLTGSGEADVTSPTPTVLLNALQEDLDPGVTCAYNSIRTPIPAIAIDPSSDIEGYEDLAGETIGVHDVASSFIPFFEAGLEEHGVDPDSVEYQVTGFGAQAANALFNGDVAASVYWDYEMGTWETLNFNPEVLSLPQETQGLFSSCLAFNDDFLQDRPDLVAGYGRAVAKSVAFAHENPEAAVRLFWEVAPETQPSDPTDEEAIDEAAHILESRVVNHVPSPDDPDPRWGAWTPEQWEQYREFLGMDSDLDVESLYTLEFIDEINDFDEGAVREMARNFEVES